MAYTLEEIEYLHDRGLMPDWAYYQQNGKSAQANFNAQQKRFAKEWKQREAERRRREQLAKEEKQLEAEIEKQVEKAIEKALEELLKDFGR